MTKQSWRSLPVAFNGPSPLHYPGPSTTILNEYTLSCLWMGKMLLWMYSIFVTFFISKILSILPSVSRTHAKIGWCLERLESWACETCLWLDLILPHEASPLYLTWHGVRRYPWNSLIADSWHRLVATGWRWCPRWKQRCETYLQHWVHNRYARFKQQDKKHYNKWVFCDWRLWLRAVTKSENVTAVIWFWRMWRTRWQGGLITDESLRTPSHMNKYDWKRILGLNVRATSAFRRQLDRPSLTMTFLAARAAEAKIRRGMWLCGVIFFADVECDSVELYFCWRGTSTWNVTASHIFGWRGMWLWQVIFWLIMLSMWNVTGSDIFGWRGIWLCRVVFGLMLWLLPVMFFRSSVIFQFQCEHYMTSCSHNIGNTTNITWLTVVTLLLICISLYDLIEWCSGWLRVTLLGFVCNVCDYIELDSHYCQSWIAVTFWKSFQTDMMIVVMRHRV